MSTDLRGLLRRRKPGRHTRPLSERAASDLLHWQALAPGGPLALLLDTNVYIHRAAGRMDPALRDLVDRALLFHCSVALGELATGIGNAQPSRPGWAAVRDHYAGLFASVPDSRLLTPDAPTWADAGLVAGILARVQGFQPFQRKECLNDALILLTAARAGLPVLTSNRREFDLIQQVAPETRFVFY